MDVYVDATERDGDGGSGRLEDLDLKLDGIARPWPGKPACFLMFVVMGFELCISSHLVTAAPLPLPSAPFLLKSSLGLCKFSLNLRFADRTTMSDGRCCRMRDVEASKIATPCSCSLQNATLQTRCVSSARVDDVDDNLDEDDLAIDH